MKNIILTSLNQIVYTNLYQEINFLGPKTGGNSSFYNAGPTKQA